MGLDIACGSYKPERGCGINKVNMLLAMKRDLQSESGSINGCAMRRPGWFPFHIYFVGTRESHLIPYLR
jgi:hypothetical protein